MQRDMVRFRMFKINVEQFALLADNPSSNLNINSKMGLDFSEENRNIRVNMSFHYVNGSTTLLVLKMNCEFNVHVDDWNSFQKEDKVVVSKSLLDYLVAQTVGTARGILHCKTEGTPFNCIVLPPMDVSHMIKGDIILNKQEKE